MVINQSGTTGLNKNNVQTESLSVESISKKMNRFDDLWYKADYGSFLASFIVYSLFT